MEAACLAGSNTRKFHRCQCWPVLERDSLCVEFFELKHLITENSKFAEKFVINNTMAWQGTRVGASGARAEPMTNLSRLTGVLTERTGGAIPRPGDRTRGSRHCQVAASRPAMPCEIEDKEATQPQGKLQ